MCVGYMYVYERYVGCVDDCGVDCAKFIEVMVYAILEEDKW